jgi:hypothetical protein
MTTRLPAVCALVATAALVAGGCSSGGGKHAATATTTVLSATTVPPAPTVPPARGVASLGACPVSYADALVNTRNVGVTGLDARLVPLAASVVRICKYAGLPVRYAGGARVTGATASQFAAETNQLASIPARPAGCGGSGGGPVGIVSGPTFLLTFASSSQQVTLVEQTAHGSGSAVVASCVLTNGVRHAQPTPEWLNEVRYDANRSEVSGATGPTPTTVTPTTGAHA